LAPRFLERLQGLGVSGVRAAFKQLVVLPDSETILLYVAKYCKENPLKKPTDGATDLHVELRRNAP